MSVSDTLAGAFNPVLAFFVLVLLIDIAFGVGKSLIASLMASRGHAVITKGFDATYLANFAKSQLLSPPVLAVAGAVLLAAQQGADTHAILAIATTAAFAQSLILSRDIFLKIRSLAGLLATPKIALPVAAAK
jgi:hypothetical protein